MFIDIGAAVAVYATFLKILLLMVSALIFVNGIDDMFIDFYYWARKAYRAVFVYRRHRRLSVDQLHDKPEQLLAIMIPAWQESPVIAQMLRNAINTLDYSNYRIFVGTYPNDPDTRREVETISSWTHLVECVTTPNDGPTSKADCLNWIIQGIRRYEEDWGLRFTAVIMHDAEDVVHPLELRMFNYLLPRFHFIQLPVYPLEPRWWQLTGGHYLDEFAENHGKDLIVRESLLKQVPCAGVAAAFERSAIEQVAERTGNLVFDTSSLTEDYEFTYRLYEMGLRAQIFASFGIEHVREHRLPWLGWRYRTRFTEYVATREMFPLRRRDAVKQKSRWIVGIVFQGWRNIRWRGPLQARYMLFRDRKGLINATTILLGYFLLLNLAIFYLSALAFPQLGRLPELIERDTLLAGVLVINGLFLGNRLIQRMIFVFNVYGVKHALLSVPRQVWGNVINFLAVQRAVYLFITSVRSGKRIAWDKTDHVFPSAEQLQPFRKRLGDMLVADGAVSPDILATAIAHHQRTGSRLGDAMIDLGFADETAIYDAIAQQLRVRRVDVSPDKVAPEVVALVPRRVAIAHSVIPVAMTDGGVLQLATDRPFDVALTHQLQSELGRPVELLLARRSDLAYTRARLYARPTDHPRATPPLGERLVSAGLIARCDLEAALSDQRSRYKSLGQILVADGHLHREELEDILARHRDGALGAYLVASDRITQHQLDSALAQQLAASPSLGQILVERGAISQAALEQQLDAHHASRLSGDGG